MNSKLSAAFDRSAGLSGWAGRVLSFFVFTATVLVTGCATEAGGADLDAWNSVLGKYHRDGGVDYAGLAADRGNLDRFLTSIAEAETASLKAPDAASFWINAYNAGVVQLVLERYPEVPSVRDVDGFFDRLDLRVGGDDLTLDEIEDKALAAGGARVHFAVVCASVGCPDLRFEAYSADRLEEQLAEQTRLFLEDTSKGMRFDEAAGELWLSSIFKWYAGDFTGGSTMVAFFARGAVANWVVGKVPPTLAERIKRADPSVKYFDYDWGLNDRKGS